MNSVFVATEGEIIPIDGKTLSGSYDKSSNKAAIHIVSAWSASNRITLGQVKTEEKSNEITAIPELLDLLEISGCIVTIDAMGCQKNIASKIREKGADYVLALKKNHSQLYKNVELFFEGALKYNTGDIQIDYHKRVDGEHGRIETRGYWVTREINWLQGKENWKDLRAIGMVRSERGTDKRDQYRDTFLFKQFRRHSREIRECSA